jgi:hypothetical protein
MGHRCKSYLLLVLFGNIARLSSGEGEVLLPAHGGYYLPMVISTCRRDGCGRGRESDGALWCGGPQSKEVTCGAGLKVHKIEIFFGFDFEICIISLLVMSKY